MMTVGWVYPGHRERWLAAMDRLQPFHQTRDWAAALYVLTAQESMWRRVLPHIDWSTGQIRWDRVRRIAWSYTESFLVDWARYLFGQVGRPDVAVMWESLDANNYTLAINALHLRRSGLDVVAA